MGGAEAIWYFGRGLSGGRQGGRQGGYAGRERFGGLKSVDRHTDPE